VFAWTIVSQCEFSIRVSNLGSTKINLFLLIVQLDIPLYALARMCLIRTYVCMYYVCTFVCMYVYVCIFVHLFACLCVCVYMYIYI